MVGLYGAKKKKKDKSKAKDSYLSGISGGGSALRFLLVEFGGDSDSMLTVIPVSD